MPPPIRYVFFDALYTIIAPRRPIAAQYNKIFASYLDPIPESAVEDSFPHALKEVQKQWPAYEGGKEAWWAEVVKRTAVGAGANAQDVNDNLSSMMETLMNVFSSREGYTLYPDVVDTFQSLKRAGIGIGIVSNADSRLRDVLTDLDVMKYLNVVIISEEEGVEKPSAALWHQACARAGINVSPAVLHVGDEMEADAWGAKQAGLDSILLRRRGVPIKKGDSRMILEGRTTEDLASVVAYVL